jgi:adenosylmethionine-8-amino-7-oxononanoate aminotransferase
VAPRHTSPCYHRQRQKAPRHPAAICGCPRADCAAEGAPEECSCRIISHDPTLKGGSIDLLVQIILPCGYLAAVYEEMHAAGAVCVADEVQCGFGRVGSHFWAFETQGVVPDMVTLGKPIGNGFPMGALVVSPRLAAGFSNGMEYFNTCGGCTAAGAAGLAVLQVTPRPLRCL